jgi:hypothetical protein
VIHEQDTAWFVSSYQVLESANPIHGTVDHDLSNAAHSLLRPTSGTFSLPSKLENLILPDSALY